MWKKTIAWVAAAGAVAGTFLGDQALRRRVPPTHDPRVDERTSVDDLAALLRGTRDAKEQMSLVRAFAEHHRPQERCSVLTGPASRMLVVVAANGWPGSPDGYDAILPSIPTSVAQVVMVAGNGMSVGILGSGGRGGVCRVETHPDLIVAGVGGDGGTGVFGGEGGNAGGGRGSITSIVGPQAIGGDGGVGFFGGSGGNGGDSWGNLPPGEPGVYAVCGHGGRGLFGGDGGGR